MLKILWGAASGKKGRVGVGVKYTGRRETLGNVLVQADLQAAMDGEVLKVSGITSNCLVLARAPQQAPFWLRNPLSA